MKLRNQAMECSFAEVMDDMLRDHVVAGIKHDDTTKMLLLNENLTVQKALEIINIDEQLEKDTTYFKRLGRDDTSEACVGEIKQSKSVNKYSNTKNTARKLCKRCGGYYASKKYYKNCFAKYLICHTCQRIGCISKICQSKKYKSDTADKFTQ